MADWKVLYGKGRKPSLQIFNTPSKKTYVEELPELGDADEIARRLPYDRWRLVPVESNSNPYGVNFSWTINLYDSPIHENRYTFLRSFCAHTITEVLGKTLDYLIDEENYQIPEL